MIPILHNVFITPEGCRGMTMRYPVAMCMRARHLPSMEHAGVTYAPYTGTVVRTEGEMARHARPRGFYMEYRALRECE